MYAITSKTGKIMAYVINQVIVNAEDGHGIGIILGNCVFDSKSNIAGKYFDNTIRDTDGYIVGEVHPYESDKIATMLPQQDLALMGWNIVLNIKEHLCGWIEARKEWSDISILAFFVKQDPALHTIGV
ncbi:hypothetical protein ACI6Q2_20670 [Chitinophagaceae bacterium LWZ2-11]